MKVVIIGNVGQGKSALIKVFKQQISTIECVDPNGQQLIDKKKEMIFKNEDIILFNDIIFNRNKHKKKGKEIKDWERTKFYQK